VRSFPAIAKEYAGADAVREARSLAYLTDNLRYGLGPDEQAGMQMFLDAAADLGLAPGRRRVEFF
jgi:predicted solute-binding protein